MDILSALTVSFVGIFVIILFLLFFSIALIDHLEQNHAQKLDDLIIKETKRNRVEYLKLSQFPD